MAAACSAVPARGMSRAPLPRAGLDMWPAGGAFVALLLLLAFALVVREGVRQGNARRQAHALLAEATWRCQALAAPGPRATCRRTYDVERPADSDGVRSLVAGVSDPR